MGRGVQMDVGRQPEVEAGAPGQQARRQVERDAVDVDAQQLTQAHIHLGHQRQGGQEMLAELAVSHPRLAFFLDLEGQAVDQHRAPVVELDVVGAGIS